MSVTGKLAHFEAIHAIQAIQGTLRIGDVDIFLIAVNVDAVGADQTN